MRLAASNPMGRVMMTTLILEVIVFGLAIPGMIMVGGVVSHNAVIVGVAGIVLALLSACLLRTRAGYPLAWLTQVGLLCLGFFSPELLIIGVVFVGLWVTCFVLGRRMEAQ